MSCNRCAATAEGVAPTAGAAHLEGNWAGHRTHPQQCRNCGGFLRADGGCTRCDTGVRSDGETLAMATPKASKAGAANVAVTMRLSCGCTKETAVPAGGEEWCTHCDDFANVAGPVSPALPAPVKTASDSPPLPRTEYGRAAFNAQHNRRANPDAQAKVKDIGYSRVALALRSVGVPRTPPADHIRNMVWQYLDRCTCGAWISPRSPVCNNPRCGQKGKTVGVSRPWPPGDVQWVFRKQDVGYEIGMAAPNPPAPKKTGGKAGPTAPAAAPPATSPAASTAPAATLPSTGADTDSPANGGSSLTVDEYKAQVERLARDYGLDADEFLPGDDWQGQIDSGETPEELVARVAEKYDLTPAGEVSDGWRITVDDTDFPADEGDDDEPAPGPFHAALSDPGVDDVETAWDELKGRYEDTYNRRPVKGRITFSEPVQVRMNNRRVLTTDNITVSLFKSQQGNFCYTYYSRTGYPLEYIRDSTGNPAVDKITGIEAVTPEETLAENKVKVQKLAQSIHPNAWPETRQLMQDKPESHADYGLNRVSMRSVFGDHVVKDLEEAFEKGKDFSYHKNGDRRDRTVEVRRQPDGTIKAWYSSEYAGCGNGDYYILLNPYTASFKETD